MDFAINERDERKRKGKKKGRSVELV